MNYILILLGLTVFGLIFIVLLEKNIIKQRKNEWDIGATPYIAMLTFFTGGLCLLYYLNPFLNNNLRGLYGILLICLTPLVLVLVADWKVYSSWGKKNE